MIFRILAWLATGAFLTEIAFLTYWQDKFSPVTHSILFFSAALLGGILALLLSLRKQPQARKTQPKLHSRILFTVLWLFVAFSFCSACYKQFQTTKPQDVSDIIPQVDVLTKRFVQGEKPYQWIKTSDWSFQHELYPTYLPLQWMPFCISQLFDFDHRWITVSAFLLAILFFVLKTGPPFPKLVLLCIPYLLWNYQNLTALYTIEMLIAAYYLFFSQSLLQKKPLLHIPGILLCLLSRYALVLWLPLYFLVIWLREDLRKAFGLASLLFAGIFFIYVVPFLRHDPASYLQGYKYHTKAALGEWQGQYWQKEGEKPYQLFRGAGLACLFYDHIEGEVSQRLEALQRTHFLFSAGIVLLLALLFLSFRQAIDRQLFLLASFKIYLVIFYHFIQIPYIYLFWVPMIVSIPLMSLVLARNRT